MCIRDRFWGNGRVFDTSLGHHDDVFDKSPTAQVLMERGMLWAGEGKQYAICLFYTSLCITVLSYPPTMNRSG